MFSCREDCREIIILIRKYGKEKSVVGGDWFDSTVMLLAGDLSLLLSEYRVDGTGCNPDKASLCSTYIDVLLFCLGEEESELLSEFPCVDDDHDRKMLSICVRKFSIFV